MMTFDEFKLAIYNNKDKFNLLKQMVAKKCAAKENIINMQAELACITREQDKAESLGHFSSIGGSALKVGSIKVSTLNLARIAYESKGKQDKYIDILKNRLLINLEALDIVRDIIKKNVDRSLLPNFNEGMLDFEHLYNTVGVNGIYETMRTFGYTEVDEFENTRYKPEAFKFSELILRTIQEVNAEFAKDKDYRINVEQVPGEQAAAKFLKADSLLYPNLVIKDLPLYGNQWIPLGIKATLKDRIEICASFDKYCNGG